MVNIVNIDIATVQRNVNIATEKAVANIQLTEMGMVLLEDIVKFAVKFVVTTGFALNIKKIKRHSQIRTTKFDVSSEVTNRT